MKKLISQYIKSEINIYASSLTYYAILSFFPFLIVFIFFINNLIIKEYKIQSFIFKNLILIIKNLPIQFNILNQNAINTIYKYNNLNIYSLIALTWAWINFIIQFSKAINKTSGANFKWNFLYIIKIISISFLTFTIIIIFNMIYFLILPYSKKIIPLPNWFYQDVILFIILTSTLFIIYKFIPLKTNKNNYKILLITFINSIILILIKHFFLNIINIHKYYLIYSALAMFIILLIWIYIEIYIILLGSIIINSI